MAGCERSDGRGDGGLTISADPEVPLVFGPIPSRRLGRSVGVNNIPPKVCSYACIYCQVGPTPSPQVEPRGIYAPETIVAAVEAHVAKVRDRGEGIDHLTFAPDGEPTLDAGLAETIRSLRHLGIPIAVISNGSLAWKPRVRDALRAADWVSVKVDAVDGSIWRRVDRPHPALGIGTVLDGIRALRDGFPGELVSETMLVAGVNDSVGSIDQVASFLGEIEISTAYVSIPTRPPAEPDVEAPHEAIVTRAHQVLAEKVPRVELLVGYEGDAFAASGDPRADVLAITAVHPMRASAVRDLLARSGGTWDVIEDLVREGLLAGSTYAGERFFVRRFPRRTGDGGRSGA